MLNHLVTSLGGWLVVGVMLLSGLLLGSICDHLLRRVGVRDRGKGP